MSYYRVLPFFNCQWFSSGPFYDMNSVPPEFGKKVFIRANQIKMRLVGWALKFACRNTHTGKTPGEDGGSDQGGASTSQESPKIANSPPEARGKARNRFSLTTSEWALLTPWSQTFRPPALWDDTFLLLRHSNCGIHCGNTRKLLLAQGRRAVSHGLVLPLLGPLFIGHTTMVSQGASTIQASCSDQCSLNAHTNQECKIEDSVFWKGGWRRLVDPCMRLLPSAPFCPSLFACTG